METDKEKLTLKELAGYLPYELNLSGYFESPQQRTVKLIAIDSQDLFTYGNFDPTWYVSAIDEFGNRGNYGALEIKPILRPLSDLIDNILEDDNDSNYRLHLELSEILLNTDCTYFVEALIKNKYYSVNVNLWSYIEEFMYKNHFDWKYKLIERGLAININDLPNE